jgi:hypothetical protein
MYAATTKDEGNTADGRFSAACQTKKLLSAIAAEGQRSLGSLNWKTLSFLDRRIFVFIH